MSNALYGGTSRDTATEIVEWQTHFGGHGGRPAAHALMTLGEVVELCFAAGATKGEVIEAVVNEVAKAKEKGEITGQYRRQAVGEELADVSVCVTLLAANNGVDVEYETRKKLPVLWSRQWTPNEDGVLKRVR